jgi:hypothetical protein
MQPSALAPPTAAHTEAGVEGRRHFETAVLICLAGKAGERRCRQGSEPGWVRWRSWDEIKAYHEAGHAVVAHLLGRYVWRLSIVPDQSVKLQKTSYVAGRCWSGYTAEASVEIPKRDRLETDLHEAARCCRILALLEAPYNWKAALRLAHRLRGRVRAMIAANWYLLSALAQALLSSRELDQAQIARFLRDETRGFAASPDLDGGL